MTHVSKIGAENPYQKTGTINQHESRAPRTGSTAYVMEMSTPPTLLRSMAILYLFNSKFDLDFDPSYSLPKLVPETNRYQIAFLVPVLAPISGKCVVGIRNSYVLLQCNLNVFKRSLIGAFCVGILCCNVFLYLSFCTVIMNVLLRVLYKVSMSMSSVVLVTITKSGIVFNVSVFLFVCVNKRKVALETCLVV